MLMEDNLFQFQRTGPHSVSGGPICLPGPSSGFSLLLHYTWFRLVFGELNSWVVWVSASLRATDLEKASISRNSKPKWQCPSWVSHVKDHQFHQFCLSCGAALLHRGIVAVQLLSCVWLSAAPWTAAHQASQSSSTSWSLLKFMSIELMMLSNHLILCQPLLLWPSIFPSFRVFSNELALCIRWPKYWNFSFSISPSNEYSGLISFRIDWFDLLAVRWTLKSLQHHNSKASILWLSTFLMV